MRVDIQRIDSGDDEVIVRYKERTPKIQKILDAIGEVRDKVTGRIIGRTESETVALFPGDIYYIESVDDKTFAYTKDEVVKLDGSLTKLLEDLDDVRFFRCSKSVIINIDKVERLKALASNRIDATMKNGEHIMISRTYASEFRRILKGGRRDG